MALEGATAGSKYIPPKTVARPPEDDPMAQINALIASLSGGGNTDYMGQAKDIYAPQFSYLDRLASESSAQAAAAKKDIGGLYSALANEIYGQAGGIKKNYDQGISSVGSAYNGALDAVGDTFDNTRNNSAEILQRLGIEQAGANVVGKSDQMEHLLTGILQANQMATQNAMRSGRSSALAYNTAQGNASKLAGGEAQTALAKQLGAFLQQISGQKAQLNSQMIQTGQGLQADAQKSALQAAQDQYRRMIDERDFNYRMAKDKADYDLRSAAQTGGSVKLDPIGKMQQLAMSLYGNQQGAANASKAVTDAFMAASAGGQKPSLGQLLNVLKQRLAHVNGGQGPGDWSSLTRLAALMYE